MSPRRPLVLLGALAAVACSGTRGPDDGPGRTTRAAIVDGKPDTTLRSVLVTGNPEMACSGFVVSEDIVLTASHCTALSTLGSACGPYPKMYGAKDVIVLDTDDLTDPKSQYLDVAEVIPLGGDSICGNDIVALRLKEPTTLPPIVPRLDRAPTLGERVTTVGFGDVDPADADSSGPRRRRDDGTVSLLGPHASGRAKALDLTASDFAVSIGPCHGDSGGPALDADGRAIGVMSRGDATTCTDMIYTRLDANAAWLRKVVRDAAVARGGAVPDWAAEPDADAATTEPDAGAAAPDPAPASASTSSCSAAPSATPASALLLAVVVLAFVRRR